MLGLPFVAEDEGASPFCAGSILATFLTGDPAVAAISASMVADSDIAAKLSASGKDFKLFRPSSEDPLRQVFSAKSIDENFQAENIKDVDLSLYSAKKEICAQNFRINLNQKFQ